MRFRRDPDKPVNIITEDDLDEAMQAAGAEFELADKSPYYPGLEPKFELEATPEASILFLAESLAVGVTTNGFVITEPTGRRLSAFLADGGQMVLTVYDDEGDYRHIRLGSDGQRSLRAWLDQAAS